MRKYTKQFSIYILFAILTLAFTSCNNDGYSLDKYWRSIVTVTKAGDNAYYFTLDNGKKLWVAAPVGFNLKPKYDRAIIDYTILSDAQGGYDHYIRLNRFYDILTKDVIYIAPGDEAKQDSIGHDPIRVHSVWEGGNYLNIHFGFNTGGVNSHRINLVSPAPDLAVSKDVVELEFRHNKNGNQDHYPANGYVSFDLAPYKTEGQSEVTFDLTWKDFDGQTKTHRIKYKYSEENDPIDDKTLNDNYDTNLNIY